MYNKKQWKPWKKSFVYCRHLLAAEKESRMAQKKEKKYLLQKAKTPLRRTIKQLSFTNDHRSKQARSHLN